MLLNAAGQPMTLGDRIFTVRGVMQFLFGALLVYGSDWDASSAMFYPRSLENIFGVGVSIDQVVLVALLCAAIVLRLSERSLTVHRNPLHVAMGLMFVVFLVSYLRLVLNEGGFRLPLEFNASTLYIAYAIALLLFPPEDAPALFVVICAAGALKGLEGAMAYILQARAEDTWGALTLWRDGFILGMYFVGWFAVYAYRSKLRPVAFWLMSGMLVIVAVGFIVSYRRSFMVALPIVAVPMWFAMKGPERWRLGRALLLVLSISVAAVLWTDLTRFLSRVAVIGNPLEEHSAAYRLFEFRNVWLTILESPWIGYPMGVPWKIHGYFPYPILSPLGGHNTYLNMLLRGGVFGLAAFLYLGWTSFRLIRKSLRLAATAVDRVVALSALGWTAMFFLASNTAPIITEPRGATLVGVMFAMVARTYDRVRLEASEESA